MAWKGGELIRHSERKLDVAKVHLHPMRYPEIHPVTGLPHSNYGANEVSGVDASSSEVSGMNSSTSNEVTGLDTNLSSTRQDIKPPAFPHDLKPPISHNDEASSSSSLPTPSTSSSSQTYDLSHLLPGLLLTGQISPAFRTYGLNISYKLKISIELKCAEKVSEHLIANHALSVWPCLFREWDEGAESTARLAVPVLTGEMGRLEINGEELPSYGDVEAGGMGNKKDIGREKEADLMGGKISKDEEARLERERNKERAGDGNGNGKGKDALPPYKETDDWK